MKRLFLFLPFLALLSSPVRAAGEPFPAGVWGLPDCEAHGQVLFLTPGFVLKSTDAASAFFTVESLPPGPGQEAVLRYNEALHVFSRAPEGGLRLGTEEEGSSVYAACPAVPATVPVPLVRAMERVEKLRAACPEKNLDEACAQALFRVADTNGNGRLSLAEFKKTGAMLGTFLPLLEGESVPTVKLAEGYGQGISDGERLFVDALRAVDNDGTGDLTPAEAGAFFRKADDVALKEARKALSKIFPALK